MEKTVTIKASVLRAMIDESVRAGLAAMTQRNADIQACERLTIREGEVLALLVEGLGNQQIGVKLGVKVDAVKIHVTHIIEKMQVENRTQAAVKAVRLGMVE